MKELKMRYKDLNKDPTPYTDAEGYTLEHSVKGSVESPTPEGPPEVIVSYELSILKEGLLEVKKDLNHIKELIDKMERNGLKMKSNW
jgi:hypothetical protein